MKYIPKRSGSKFTTEIIELIKANNSKSNLELSELIRLHFRISFTTKQIRKAKTRHGIKGSPNVMERPLFFERIKDGDVYIKISNEIGGLNWRLKQRWIWEQAHGKIQKGCCVIFLDKNKRNFNLENLALVTHAEKIKLSQYDLWFNDAEQTKIGLAIVKHKLAISKALIKGLSEEEGKRTLKKFHKKNRREKQKIISRCHNAEAV